MAERKHTRQSLARKSCNLRVRKASRQTSASDPGLDVGMPLRVLAVTAPQFGAGQIGCMALSSGDAASLYNACRYAAHLSETGDPSWSASNWNTSRRVRRESVLLLHDMDHANRTLTKILPTLRPNLVLISAMSICMPGAIAVAKTIRKELGDDVLIVLGGRHVNETVYNVRGKVAHHAASPLRLMASGRIAPQFDLVVSGDGEAIIAEIGRSVASITAKGKPARDARFELNRLLTAPGMWLAGIVDDDSIHIVRGQAGTLNYEMMP